MCGISGTFSDKRKPDPGILASMAEAIIHRGPDDGGLWHDDEAGIGFAHRRLSILDLSPAGHQPMISPSGRFVIVFNGEIYNHLDLRQELAAQAWRGHSDTETLLAGFEAWGTEATLRKTVGMFAIALWDRTERILFLARDRMGEKPLYFGWNRGAFLFASELKALRAYPGFEAEINRNALTLLLRHNYIPAPYSIYRGIFKLFPATMLTVQEKGCGACPWDVDAPPFGSFQGGGVSSRPYWSLREVAERGQSHPFAGTENETVAELERVLADAVLSQQISDVPLGVFLSGGVDSSAIVALMQAQSSRPVRSFTIGFHEKGYNEALHAKAVAQHIGTDHTELYVNPSDALSVIPKLPSLYDEPFSDSSQIPTFLISELTRRHVTVSLSGDAGDELFGGYNRYFLGDDIWRKFGWMPPRTRNMVAGFLKYFSPTAWDSIFACLNPVIPQRFRQRRAGDQLHKLAEIIQVKHLLEMYHGLVSHWKEPSNIVLGSSEPITALTDESRRLLKNHPIIQMMYMDMITYLPDDILVKVDRAAMAVSLETRVPFLDHRVIEFAWRLPLSMKIRNGQGKWILRQVLYKYVPRELIERPKTGFGVPIDRWLRTDLRDWAENLLDEKRLKDEGYFNPQPIRQKWEEHLSGTRNWQYHLWDILMFQAWLEQNRGAM